MAKDGRTAVVVPPANADALADAIHTMLGQPERRRALGAAARVELQQNRSWADFAEQLEAVYDRLTKESY